MRQKIRRAKLKKNALTLFNSLLHKWTNNDQISNKNERQGHDTADQFIERVKVDCENIYHFFFCYHRFLSPKISSAVNPNTIEITMIGIINFTNCSPVYQKAGTSTSFIKSLSI
ncbi:MAG: hypothetical protein [Circular genetic element sp.]|nr:MAG: hypothetical protein [Circular genetic element sp.]